MHSTQPSISMERNGDSLWYVGSPVCSTSVSCILSTQSVSFHAVPGIWWLVIFGHLCDRISIANWALSSNPLSGSNGRDVMGSGQTRKHMRSETVASWTPLLPLARPSTLPARSKQVPQTREAHAQCVSDLVERTLYSSIRSDSFLMRIAVILNFAGMSSSRVRCVLN